MFEALGNLFGGKPPKKGSPPEQGPRPQPSRPAQTHAHRERRQTFSKVFRWQAPAGQKAQPNSVEVLGTFSNWEKVPLVFDPAMKSWQVTVEQIAGNRTHHYVLLVDGKPTYDKACDGLAIPEDAQAQQWQIPTEKGGRVMMLFSQTK